MSRDSETALHHKVGGLVFKDDVVKRLMPAKDLNLQLKWIKETQIRDDDVIICAFPKTGNYVFNDHPVTFSVKFRQFTTFVWCL